MNHPDYFLLGKILRTHGVKGDVVVFIDADDPMRYRKMKKLMIEINDELVQFNADRVSIKEGEQTAIIHIDGVNDMHAAEQLLKKNLYQPLSMLRKLKGNAFYFHEIMGYKVDDKSLGELGTVSNVHDLPQHPVIAMMYKEKEVLIPLSIECFIELDRENRKIFVQLPDGLLDVYL